MIGSSSGTVLGTRVERLPDSPGPALLISDLHVPEDGGRAFDNLLAALAAAQRIGARLFVLGDLFDSYVASAQMRVGIWREVAAAMASAAANGVAIDVLVGNRDFLLGPEFTTASRACLHHGGLRLALGGVETLLLHGDELCQNDLPYQRAKRWLRGSAVRFSARRLPLRLALWVAARARRRSREVIAGGDQTRFLPTSSALCEALSGGVERVVFGHIHRHATVAVGGRQAFVLPAFDSTPAGYLTAAAVISAVRFDGGEGNPVEISVPMLDLSGT
ncbi:MAG: metallophosphoesterase [Planctomycetes bacterium]|nr:metallophosphoesterase [Planctomycetota bacterium]